MNASVLKQLKNALANHIDTGGETGILNGEEIEGIADQVEVMTELKNGMGFLPSLALQFIIPIDEPSEAPKSGDELILRDVERRVEKVEQDEISYTLTCMNSTR